MFKSTFAQNCSQNTGNGISTETQKFKKSGGHMSHADPQRNALPLHIPAKFPNFS
jgi:hypothetical protein